jgi:hypothetical protein
MDAEEAALKNVIRLPQRRYFVMGTMRIDWLRRSFELVRKLYFPYQSPHVAYTALPHGRGRNFNP